MNDKDLVSKPASFGIQRPVDSTYKLRRHIPMYPCPIYKVIDKKFEFFINLNRVYFGGAVMSTAKLGLIAYSYMMSSILSPISTLFWSGLLAANLFELRGASNQPIIK